MTLLFGRKTELHVFADNQKYTIRDLDMSFDILATRDSKPNTAKIDVYNLSETSRNLFSESTQGVEFWAGYGDDIGMIFRGSWDKDTSIIKHKHRWDTWLTSIETGDGLKEFQNTYFDRSYSRGTSVKQILKDVANAMGLPVMLDYGSDNLLNSGAMFSGKAKDVLDDLVSEYLLRWSIQHGVVEIVNRYEAPSNDSTAILLTPDTGLVGRPTITKDGLVCNSLMLSKIKPTRLIQIDPASVDTNLGNRQDAIKSGIKANASGLYIVDYINYVGDNMSGPFDCRTTCELKK